MYLGSLQIEGSTILLFYTIGMFGINNTGVDYYDSPQKNCLIIVYLINIICLGLLQYFVSSGSSFNTGVSIRVQTSFPAPVWFVVD